MRFAPPNVAVVALRLALVVVGLLGAGSGRAQGLVDPHAGQVLPNSQSAAVDDATALMVNPAGLAWVEGLELQSGWQTRIAPAPGDDLDFGHVGDMEAVVGGPFGILAGGLGLELPSSAAAPRLRASLGSAVALDHALSVGATVHGVRALGAGSSDVYGDLGFQLRPARFIAFGLVAEQLGAKAGAAVRGGVSVRPLGEMLTVGVDARFRPASGDLTSAFVNGGFDPALSARLDLGGAVIVAGAQLQNLNASAAVPIGVEASAAVQLDLENIGMTLLGGASGLGTGTVTGIAGARSRFSSTAWESLLSPGGRWVGLTLTGDGVPLREGRSVVQQLFDEEPSSMWVLAALDNLADDDSVDGLVLRLQGLQLGWGRATELRAAILKLRANGKTVAVHLDGGDDIDVFVASAADKVWMTPTGGLGLDGLRAQMVYVGSTLDKIGVKAEAVAAGRYKSAPRMFTHDEPSAEEIEVENALLDGVYTTLTTAVAAGRGLGVDEVKAIIDLGGLTGPEAVEKKIVDELAYDDQLPELVAALSGRPGEKAFIEGAWLDRTEKLSRWEAPPRVALIPIVGAISMGRAGGGLFSQGGAGAEDVVDAVNQAAEDSSVKAIVLRIDSPGGDALASDLIWRAVMLARDKKPVIATMGDVAASGGYYIAAAAHEILAEDDTITGSIGVFALLFSAGQLASDLGVRSFELQRGARPGPDLFRGPTADERARMQEHVDQTYEQFLDAIVAGRGSRIAKEDLRAIAGGRVWTGKEAIERKLVDRSGSVVDAIKLARERAGLSEDEPLELSVMTGREGELPGLGALGSVMSSVLGISKTEGLSAAMRLLLGDPEMAAFVVDTQGRPLALGPRVDIR